MSSRCTKKVRVSTDLEAVRQSAINAADEKGGTVKIDFQQGMLYPGTTAPPGAFKEITIDRAHIDWHSHSTKCRNGECPVGVPSASDMINVLLGSRVEPGYVHLLFSKDGTYTFQVGPRLMTRIRTDHNLALVVCSVCKLVDLWHNKYARDSIAYTKYQTALLRGLRSIGFVINHFRPGETPEITLHYPCDYDTRAPFVPHISVSTPSFVMDQIRTCSSGENH